MSYASGALFFKCRLCRSIHAAQGETVSCSNCDLVKISAQLSGLSQAGPLTSCTIPIKQNKPLQSKIHLISFPKLSQRHRFVIVISSRVLHSSFILHSVVTPLTASSHRSATSEGVQTIQFYFICTGPHHAMHYLKAINTEGVRP